MIKKISILVLLFIVYTQIPLTFAKVTCPGASNSTLTWTTANPGACASFTNTPASGPCFFNPGTGNGSQSVALGTSCTATLTCWSGAGGTGSILSQSSDSLSYDPSKTWDGSACVTPPGPPPSVSVSWINPVIVDGGMSTFLYSSTENPSSCSATLTGWTSWSGGLPVPSFSNNLGPFGGNVTATVTCTNGSGSDTQSATLTVCAPGDIVSGGTCMTPSSAPVVTFLYFAPSSILEGEASQVYFSSTNATACFASGLWNGNIGMTSANGVSTGVMNTPGTYSQSIYCTGPGGTSPTVTTNLTVGSSAVCQNGASNPPACTTGATSICGPLSTAQGAPAQVSAPTGANACTAGAYSSGATDPNTWLWNCGAIQCSVPKGLPAGVDCAATTVTWGSCTGVTTASTPYSFAVPPGFPTSNTYALDSNSYTVIGSYVGSAQYTCTNHVLSAPTSQSCNQILCDVATDASGSFAPCSGVCANGGTPYPACPYPPGVDLTSPFPPNFAAPVTAYIGVPINLKGWVSNNWVSDTPTGFNNFFQPQEDSSIVLGSVINTPVLLGFDIREFTNTYTPSASDVAGMGALAATFASTGVATFNYRLCVDKSSPGDTGLVAERDENNNCGNYSTITLHACANNAINNPACNQCPAGLAWNGATCIPCDNGGCTGAGGNPTTPLGSLVCINGANNPTQCNQCPANLAWDTGTHSCVPCGGGACTGTVGGSSGDPVGNLVCNDGPQATPPTCSFYAANPSPCYILDGANSCLTDLTWSAKFSVIDISDFTWIVHDQTTRNVAGLSSTVMYGGTTFSLPNYWGGLLVADGPSSIFVDGLCLVGSVYDAGNTNTCIASGAPFPDLTIGVTDKTSFDIGQATVVTASITNIGNANAVGSFSTIFQVSTGSNGTGAVTDYPATTINSISSAASKTTQHTFTFIAGQTGSMRACADTPNPGTINESNEGNNCSGAWTDFSVTGCPVGTQWDTMNSACVNPQVGTYIVVNDYYPPGSLDFTCLGSTDYTILNTSVVPTAVVVGTTSYSGSVSYATSSEAQYQVRCLSGSVADSKPLYYHATPGTTIINIIATPKTIAPTEKITLSWDTKFPDNTCALTAKVVCANNACNVGQAAEQVRLSAILAATTTDSNDPFGPSRNLQSAVKTVAPGHTTTDFKALGRKTLSVKYTTDFTYDCGVRGKETKRVQVTRSEEQ